MLRPLLLLLLMSSPHVAMTSAASKMSRLLANTRGRRIPRVSACRTVETEDGGMTVRCSGLRLMQIPVGLSNCTTRLFLNKNLLSSLPANSFSRLLVLDELDLSHNMLSSLAAGCFSGLTSSLRFLDLSSNQLSTLDPAVFAGLQVFANLTHNPWHCDCSLQLSMPMLHLDSSSFSEAICRTSDIPNLGAVGVSLVQLVEDWDLCRCVRKSTDVLTLLIMFLWFVMLLSYFLHYIRQNQAVARRHFDYLQFLQRRDPFQTFKPI